MFIGFEKPLMGNLSAVVSSWTMNRRGYNLPEYMPVGATTLRFRTAYS